MSMEQTCALYIMGGINLYCFAEYTGGKLT